MKLIIINGPCGVGKSTLAEKLHKNMPLSFWLDIDAQRRFVSGYREHKIESGEFSALIANNIIQTCLENKVDVIVDKMIVDENIMDAYYKISQKFNIEIFEIILWAPKEEVMKRAHARGWRKGGMLTPERCEILWGRVDEFKKTRPQAKIVNVESMGEDEVFDEVNNIINND